jgi:hypothetical protein
MTFEHMVVMTFEHMVVFAGLHIVFVTLSLFSARKHVVSVHQQTHLRRTKMSWTQGIQGLNENKKVQKDGVGNYASFVVSSVADPGPSDPYVFGPPGSGSICQRYGSGSFYHKAKLVRKTLIPTAF